MPIEDRSSPDSWGFEPIRTKRAIPSRFRFLTWSGLFVLSVYAFATEFGLCLTLVIGWLMLVWEEYRLARWVKRTDSDRRRGATCFLFYLTWGIGKSILMMFGLMFLFVIVQVALEGPATPGKPPSEPGPLFITTSVLVGLGFFVQGPLSLLAFLSALRSRVKVWVGPEARWARDQNVWPPQALSHKEVTTNRAKIIILSALIVLYMFGALFLSLLIPWMVDRLVSSKFFVVLFLVYLGGGVIVICVLLDRLGARMIATTPSECWTDRR